jgi:ADP-ribosylglycohydrolase
MTHEPGDPRTDRYVGALLGVHAGDCLGATVEFLPWSQLRQIYPGGVRDIVGGGPFDWPPGHATDDTDLTRAVLLAHLDRLDCVVAVDGTDRAGARRGRRDVDGHDEDVVMLAADHMLDWFDGRWPDRTPGSRPRDIGGATLTGLANYGAGRDPRACGAGVGRAGNGSLMRCIATALATTDQPRRIQESVEISAITHDDPRATLACAAYNEMVVVLLDGGTPAAAFDEGRRAVRLALAPAWAAADGADVGAAATAVVDAIEVGTGLRPATLAATGPAGLSDDGGGFVLDSLILAVAAAADPRPFVDVLVDVVRVGRDTDTNGAIAGGLLGARDGAAAIPAHWVQRLQFRDEFRSGATRLAAGARLMG